MTWKSEIRKSKIQKPKSDVLVHNAQSKTAKHRKRREEEKKAECNTIALIFIVTSTVSQWSTIATEAKRLVLTLLRLWARRATCNCWFLCQCGYNNLLHNRSLLHNFHRNLAHLGSNRQQRNNKVECFEQM